MNKREGPGQNWGGTENQDFTEKQVTVFLNTIKNIRNGTSGKTENFPELSCIIKYRNANFT